MLAMSPTVVLLAVFLWTYLWGLFGAFIGVPIVIAIVTFCAHHPSSRWIADLLGGPVEGKEAAMVRRSAFACHANAGIQLALRRSRFRVSRA